MKRIISIDHGNRLCKSIGSVFPSAFIDSEYLPAIGGDVLKYSGKSYTLVDQCLPVLNDKTEDERYFILTLIAIGKELAEEAEMIRRVAPITQQNPIDVELLIGLPLQHYSVYKQKFERYFIERKGVIQFELNGKPYSIRITNAKAFPQAYAAAITVSGSLKDSKVVNIVDIGGFTVDCLQLVNFNPNLTLCTSLYLGVNTLFQSINERVRSTGARDISDSIIEGILKKESSALEEYSKSRIDVVTTAAFTHADRILSEVAQRGFDLTEDKTVFMGGGSILLKEYLLEAGKAKKPIFVDDIHANAKGYRLIYDMQNSGASNRNCEGVQSGNVNNSNSTACSA